MLELRGIQIISRHRVHLRRAVADGNVGTDILLICILVEIFIGGGIWVRIFLHGVDQLLQIGDWEILRRNICVWQ